MSNNFQFSDNSLKKMKDLHPDLRVVLVKALELSDVDFGITEGSRTMEKQQEYVAKGKSRTYNSRHVPENNECNMACAVDVHAVIDGKISWSWGYYEQIAKAMKEAADIMNVPIVWGGDWETLKDGVHFELDQKIYPRS